MPALQMAPLRSGGSRRRRRQPIVGADSALTRVAACGWSFFLLVDRITRAQRDGYRAARGGRTCLVRTGPTAGPGRLRVRRRTPRRNRIAERASHPRSARGRASRSPRACSAQPARGSWPLRHSPAGPASRRSSCHQPFDNDKEAVHLANLTFLPLVQLRLLENAIQCTRSQIVVEASGNRDSPRLGRVFVLPVATLRRHQIPPTSSINRMTSRIFTAAPQVRVYSSCG